MQIDAVIASTNTSYLTSGATLIMGLSWNQWLSVLSGLFLVLTYLTSLYFQCRRDRREQKLLELKKENNKSEAVEIDDISE